MMDANAVGDAQPQISTVVAFSFPRTSNAPAFGRARMAPSLSSEQMGGPGGSGRQFAVGPTSEWRTVGGGSASTDGVSAAVAAVTTAGPMLRLSRSSGNLHQLGRPSAGFREIGQGGRRVLALSPIPASPPSTRTSMAGSSSFAGSASYTSGTGLTLLSMQQQLEHQQQQQILRHQHVRQLQQQQQPVVGSPKLLPSQTWSSGNASAIAASVGTARFPAEQQPQQQLQPQQLAAMGRPQKQQGLLSVQMSRNRTSATPSSSSTGGSAPPQSPFQGNTATAAAAAADSGVEGRARGGFGVGGGEVAGEQRVRGRGLAAAALGLPDDAAPAAAAASSPPIQRPGASFLQFGSGSPAAAGPAPLSSSLRDVMQQQQQSSLKKGRVSWADHAAASAAAERLLAASTTGGIDDEACQLLLLPEVGRRLSSSSSRRGGTNKAGDGCALSPIMSRQLSSSMPILSPLAAAIAADVSACSASFIAAGGVAAGAAGGGGSGPGGTVSFGGVVCQSPGLPPAAPSLKKKAGGLMRVSQSCMDFSSLSGAGTESTAAATAEAEPETADAAGAGATAEGGVAGSVAGSGTGATAAAAAAQLAASTGFQDCSRSSSGTGESALTAAARTAAAAAATAPTEGSGGSVVFAETAAAAAAAGKGSLRLMVTADQQQQQQRPNILMEAFAAKGSRLPVSLSSAHKGSFPSAAAGGGSSSSGSTTATTIAGSAGGSSAGGRTGSTLGSVGFSSSGGSSGGIGNSNGLGLLSRMAPQAAAGPAAERAVPSEGSRLQGGSAAAAAAQAVPVPVSSAPSEFGWICHALYCFVCAGCSHLALVARLSKVLVASNHVLLLSWRLSC